MECFKNDGFFFFFPCDKNVPSVDVVPLGALLCYYSILPKSILLVRERGAMAASNQTVQYVVPLAPSRSGISEVVWCSCLSESCLFPSFFSQELLLLMLRCLFVCHHGAR